jgi:hypothetical protein
MKQEKQFTHYFPTMKFFAEKTGSGRRLNLGEIGRIPPFSEFFGSNTSRDREVVLKNSLKL